MHRERNTSAALNPAPVPHRDRSACLCLRASKLPLISSWSPFSQAWIVAADSVGASSYRRPHYLFERPRTKNQELSRCTSEDAHCAPFLCLEPHLVRSHKLRGAPLCIIHRIHRSSARCNLPNRTVNSSASSRCVVLTVFEARTRGAGQLADTRTRARLHGTAANPKLAVPLPSSARILQTTYGLIRTRHRARSRRRPSYRSRDVAAPLLPERRRSCRTPSTQLSVRIPFVCRPGV